MCYIKSSLQSVKTEHLHEQCSTCRSTLYSFCNNNSLVVTLFIVSVSSTDSKKFRQHAEWRLQYKTTHVKKNSTSAFETWNSYFFPWRNSLQWPTASSLSRLHDHRHTTLGRIPLDEWSARRRALYLTTHNTHIHAPPGFDHAIPASERPQTHALDRAVSGIGLKFI